MTNRTKAFCYPDPLFFNSCPNSSPKLGNGFTNDITLLAFQFAGLPLPNFETIHSFLSIDKVVSTNFHLVPLFFDLKRETIDNYRIPSALSMFFVRKVIVFNAANLVPRSSVGISDFFTWKTWVLGLFLYGSIIISLFLLERQCFNFIDAAYRISFTQKNVIKWRNLGPVAGFLITVWSLSCYQVRIQVKGQVVRAMAPLIQGPEFETLLQLSKLVRSGKYEYVSEQDWDDCSAIAYDDVSKEFCDAVAGNSINAKSVKEMHELLLEKEGRFIWTEDRIAKILLQKFPSVLHQVQCPEMTSSIYPLFTIPKMQDPEEKREASLRLQRKLEKGYQILIEIGVFDKVHFDYFGSMLGEKLSRPVTAINLERSKFGFQVLAAGLGLSAAYLCIEKIAFVS